jgi:hypothetical protein
MLSSLACGGSTILMAEPNILQYHLQKELIRHSRPPEDGNHMPKHVGVENLERINKTSTTSLSICWSYCKRQDFVLLDGYLNIILSEISLPG